MYCPFPFSFLFISLSCSCHLIVMLRPVRSHDVFSHFVMMSFLEREKGVAPAGSLLVTPTELNLFVGTYSKKIVHCQVF